MNAKKKPFVISVVPLRGPQKDDGNPKLHYAYSRIDAIEFAKQYYEYHDVLAKDVDEYKASFVLELERVDYPL